MKQTVFTEDSDISPGANLYLKVFITGEVVGWKDVESEKSQECINFIDVFFDLISSLISTIKCEDKVKGLLEKSVGERESE